MTFYAYTPRLGNKEDQKNQAAPAAEGFRNSVTGSKFSGIWFVSPKSLAALTFSDTPISIVSGRKAAQPGSK